MIWNGLNNIEITNSSIILNVINVLMFNLHNKRAPRSALGYTWEYIHSNDSTDGWRRKKMDVLSYMKTQSNLTPHLLAHDNGSGCAFFHFSPENFLPFLSPKSALTDSAEKKKLKIFSHMTLELFIHEYPQILLHFPLFSFPPHCID